MARERSAAFFLCLFLPVLSTAHAQSGPVDSTRATWLAAHLISLDTLAGPRGETQAASFLQALAGARVVAFGEPTHGDGAAFVLRNRLTRMLHERGGFSVLAIETLGLFDDPAVIDSGAAWVWSGSAEARPGLDYARRQRHAPHPLRLTGLDVQHALSDSLFAGAERALQRLGAIDERWPDVKRVLHAAFSNPFAPVDSSLQGRVLDAVRAYVEALSAAGAPRPALFLANARSNALTAWRQSYNPRDRQMGENLIHLAEEAYPESRIMVWAASSHAVRTLAAIDHLDPEWSYDDSVPLGRIVTDSLGDGYYVIAFTACGGSYGASHLGLAEKQLEAPQPGSLEALACAAPFERAAFLDLRGLSQMKEGAWLWAPLLARPLGYRTMRASWPVVLDGLIVIRTMQPSTPATMERRGFD